jgi:gas vesicle protein
MSDDGGGGGYLRGVITGLLFGAAAALLMAPKPGGALRHDLAEGASRLKDKAGSLGGSVADTVADTAQGLRERGQDVATNVQGAGNDALADAADYAQAMKEESKGGEHDVIETV